MDAEGCVSGKEINSKEVGAYLTSLHALIDAACKHCDVKWTCIETIKSVWNLFLLKYYIFLKLRQNLKKSLWYK